MEESTLFARLFHLRALLLKSVKKESLSHRVVWREDGSELVLSWAFIHERRFKLAEISHASFIAVDVLDQALRTLVPEGILSGLSFSSFQEDLGANSIFSAPQTIDHLRPSIQKLYAHISSSIDQGQDTLERLLRRSQEFLRLFAVALYLTTGIPPSSSQSASLTYASQRGFRRNLVMLDTSQVILLFHPDHSQSGYRTKGADRVNHFPCSVAWPLLVYLGVFRPVETSLFEASCMEDKVRILSLEPMLTHIFCDPRRTHKGPCKSIIWAKDNIDAVLLSGPMAMEAFPHRLVFQAIMQREYAELITTLQAPSVFDEQGQHAQRTSKQHYAVPQMQRFSGIQFSSSETQVRSCEAMHSFAYLIRPILSDPATSTSINNTIHRYQEHALQVARDVVAGDYGLATYRRDAAAVAARTLYRDQPFLISKFPNVQVGDKGLFRVFWALGGGHWVRSAENQSLSLFNKVLLHLTASAATLVSLHPRTLLQAY